MRALGSGLSASLLVLGSYAAQPQPQPQAQVTPENAALDSLPEVKLPHSCRNDGPANLYPQAAERARLQGRVLVEFDLDPKGRPTHARVVAEEPVGVFAKGTLRWAQNYRCPGAPPAGQKIRLTFIYAMIPCPHAAPCQVPKAYPTMSLPIIVTAGGMPTRADFDAILKQAMSP